MVKTSAIAYSPIVSKYGPHTHHEITTLRHKVTTLQASLPIQAFS